MGDSEPPEILYEACATAAANLQLHVHYNWNTPRSSEEPQRLQTTSSGYPRTNDVSVGVHVLREALVPNVAHHVAKCWQWNRSASSIQMLLASATVQWRRQGQFTPQIYGVRVMQLPGNTVNLKFSYEHGVLLIVLCNFLAHFPSHLHKHHMEHFVRC